jgi:pSer/pThr/pTyr-binding forkhead associated (FHA) protein
VLPQRPSAPELKEQIAAEGLGEPFLVHRDANGRQVITSLRGDRLTLGRDMGVDVLLGWDSEVSRVHAELQRLGSAWMLVDDGLSRNGSWVNGKRISGRARLSDGDELRLGNTTLTYREAGGGIAQETSVSTEALAGDEPSAPPA